MCNSIAAYAILKGGQNALSNESSLDSATTRSQQAGLGAQQAEVKRAVSEFEAARARDEGEINARAAIDAARARAGRLRAEAAGAGIDANLGTPALLQADQEARGLFEAMLQRNKAERDAWEHEIDARAATNIADFQSARQKSIDRTAVLDFYSKVLGTAGSMMSMR